MHAISNGITFQTLGRETTKFHQSNAYKYIINKLNDYKKRNVEIKLLGPKSFKAMKDNKEIDIENVIKFTDPKDVKKSFYGVKVNLTWISSQNEDQGFSTDLLQGKQRLIYRKDADYYVILDQKMDLGKQVAKEMPYMNSFYMQRINTIDLLAIQKQNDEISKRLEEHLVLNKQYQCEPTFDNCKKLSMAYLKYAYFTKNKYNKLSYTMRALKELQNHGNKYKQDSAKCNQYINNIIINYIPEEVKNNPELQKNFKSFFTDTKKVLNKN